MLQLDVSGMWFSLFPEMSCPVPLDTYKPKNERGCLFSHFYALSSRPKDGSSSFSQGLSAVLIVKEALGFSFSASLVCFPQSVKHKDVHSSISKYLSPWVCLISPSKISWLCQFFVGQWSLEKDI